MVIFYIESYLSVVIFDVSYVFFIYVTFVSRCLVCLFAFDVVYGVLRVGRIALCCFIFVLH